MRQNRTITLTLSILFFLFIHMAQAQAFWTDNFDSTAPSSGDRDAPNHADRDNGTDATVCGAGDYFYRTNLAVDAPNGVSITFSGFSGSYWRGEDLDGCIANPDVINWTGIDISGRSNIQFSGLFGGNPSNSFEADDEMAISYSIDGGPYTKILSFRGSVSPLTQDTDLDGTADGTTLGTTLTEFTAAISETGTTLSLRITLDMDGGSEEFAFDQFELEELSSATITWDGSTDNDWNTPSNWDSNSVPTSIDNVVIPSSLSNYPTASSAVSVSSVSMASGTSLIAQSTFAGTITYNRSLGTNNWYLVGAPVSGETMQDMISNNSFATGSDSNIGIAPYDNSQSLATDRWDYQTATSTGSLISGGGYSVKLSSSGTLAFSGDMETSNVGTSISDGSGSGGTAFNLIGNPYPSFLAANSNADGTNNLLTVNSASLTEQTLWLWNQASSSYEIYNHTSSAFYIAPAQGFFVSSTGNNTFNFTEAMQSHQSSDSFQRQVSNRPEINLVVSDGTNSRDTHIFYIDGTTTGFDNGYDSSIFNGTDNSFAIYTQAVANGNGRNLGIQSLPNNSLDTMIIPVGIHAASGAQIEISASALNLPTGIKIYLEDKTDGTFTLLSDTENFTTNLSSSLNGIGRFYLHTTSQTLSSETIDLNHISIYPYNSTVLRIVGVHGKTAKVTMYSLLGAQVLKTSFQGNGLNEIELPHLKVGVYIVQLQTEIGILNQKVIIE